MYKLQCSLRAQSDITNVEGVNAKWMINVLDATPPKHLKSRSGYLGPVTTKATLPLSNHTSYLQKNLSLNGIYE